MTRVAWRVYLYAGGPAGAGAATWVLVVVVVIVVTVGGLCQNCDWVMNMMPQMMDQTQPRRKMITVASCRRPTQKLTQKVAILEWLWESGLAAPHSARKPEMMVPNPGMQMFTMHKTIATAGCTVEKSDEKGDQRGRESGQVNVGKEKQKEREGEGRGKEKGEKEFSRQNDQMGGKEGGEKNR